MPWPLRLEPSKPGGQCQHMGVLCLCLVGAISKPLPLTPDSEYRWMGGEVANTSLLTHCQGSFCRCWVRMSSIDLPETPQMKVPEGSTAFQEGPRHAKPRFRTSGLVFLSPLPLQRQLAPSRTLCTGLLSPAGLCTDPGGARQGARCPRSWETFPCGQRGIRRRSQIYVQAGGNVPGWEEPAAEPL